MTICIHPGYLVKEGELRCVKCNELSPRAKLVNGQLVRIGEKPISCPKCGTVIQVGPEEKMASQPENKMAAVPEHKGIWPPQIRRGRPKK